MCLTLGVTILDSTKEIQLLFSSQFNVGSPLCSSKACSYLSIAFVFLIALYMHLIYPSVESEAISSCIYNFQNTAILRRVWIIPETNRLLLAILAWSASLWNYKHLGCVVLNFIHAPCKYDDIWAIIRISRIKDGFMRVTIQMLNTALDALETRKIRE